MPAQYEHIRDSYLKRGVSEKEAKKLGAMTYNARHPGHPMHPDKGDKVKHMKRGGHSAHKAKPGITPALLAAMAGPPPGAPPGPMGPGPGGPPGMPGAGSPPPGPPGMKHGGHAKRMKHSSTKRFAAGGETVKSEQGSLKHWPLKGEEKDAHGEKVAMKKGGRAKKHHKYASGGYCRGDGIAERGHTRGTFR
jgi:hypothetical protein